MHKHLRINILSIKNKKWHCDPGVNPGVQMLKSGSDYPRLDARQVLGHKMKKYHDFSLSSRVCVITGWKPKK